MKGKTRKAMTIFGFFTLIISGITIIVSLANHYLRIAVFTTNPKVGSVLLLLPAILGYYSAWRWLCRKLDSINKDLKFLI